MRLDAFQISPIFTIVVILLLHCYVLFIGSAVALPTRLQTRHFFAILRPAAGSMQFLLLQTNLQTSNFSVFRKTFATPDFFGQKIGTKKKLGSFHFSSATDIFGSTPDFFQKQGSALNLDEVFSVGVSVGVVVGGLPILADGSLSAP